MELQQYLHILKRYWRGCLATVFLCLAAAGGYTMLQTPTYTTSSTVFLTVESGGTAGELSQGATYAERQVTSFVKVATTAKVLAPVISQLDLQVTPDQLASRLTVTSPASTSIINISADSSQAQPAADLANAVAASLVSAVEELSPPGPDGTRLVSATIIDDALVPATPSAPRPAMNLALGGLLGVLLGFGQALVRHTLDNRLISANDLEQVTDAPILATIGTHDTSADRAVPEGARWANDEAYRRLRTNVGFVGLGGERRSSIVVTSSVAGEGKTETIVNLAKVLAQAGESVLLVDADLRRPMVAERMRIDGELGLTDILTGRGKPADLIIDVAPGYLAVLPAGTVPPNPSELLGSEAMGNLLEALEERYDYVLLDTPPLLPVTDAVVLAAQTGGAIVVARSGQVRRPQLEAALGILDAGDVTVLGTVLNDVPAKQSAYYGGYYHATHHRTPGTPERVPA